MGKLWFIPRYGGLCLFGFILISKVIGCVLPASVFARCGKVGMVPMAIVGSVTYLGGIFFQNTMMSVQSGDTGAIMQHAGSAMKLVEDISNKFGGKKDPEGSQTAAPKTDEKAKTE